ncbi:MAG: hypothetical protein JXR42_03465 [Gammaproteobacteria bacterium]|nr:hypothetical protein [Gammaproteobacteria bacterium]
MRFYIRKYIEVIISIVVVLLVITFLFNIVLLRHRDEKVNATFYMISQVEVALEKWQDINGDYQNASIKNLISHGFLLRKFADESQVHLVDPWGNKVDYQYYPHIILHFHDLSKTIIAQLREHLSTYDNFNLILKFN